MPIYEYQCTNCKHQFDRLQKFNDEHVKTCPECDQETAVRLVSAAAFQLKGTGWYATDFKDKGKPEKKEEKVSTLKSADLAVAKDIKRTEPKKAEVASVSTTKGERD